MVEDGLRSAADDVGGDTSVAAVTVAWWKRPARREGRFITGSSRVRGVPRAAALLVPSLSVSSSTGEDGDVAAAAAGCAALASEWDVSSVDVTSVVTSAGCCCRLPVSVVAVTTSLSSIAVGLLASSLLLSAVRGLYTNWCHRRTHTHTTR